MEHKREHLNALLDLIEAIGLKSENAWFLAELRKRIKPYALDTNMNLLSIAGRRFRYEGNKFYFYINDNSRLRNELSEYYKRMRIAYLLGNYIQYALSFTLQLETLFTFLCHKLDAWEQVKSNYLNNNSFNTIRIIQQNLGHEDKIYLFDEFYIKEKNSTDSFPYKRKPISHVSYKCKAAFCLDHFKIKGYERNWGNFLHLYKIRNYASHTQVGDSEKSSVEKIMEGFTTKIGFYEQTLRSYSSCLRNHFQST